MYHVNEINRILFFFFLKRMIILGWKILKLETCSTSKIENPNEKATRNIASISNSLTTVLVILVSIIMKIPK